MQLLGQYTLNGVDQQLIYAPFILGKARVEIINWPQGYSVYGGRIGVPVYIAYGVHDTTGHWFSSDEQSFSYMKGEITFDPRGEWNFIRVFTKVHGTIVKVYAEERTSDNEQFIVSFDGNE